MLCQPDNIALVVRGLVNQRDKDWGGPWLAYYNNSSRHRRTSVKYRSNYFATLKHSSANILMGSITHVFGKELTMHYPPLLSRLSRVPRVLWLTILIFAALVAWGEPASWAAPVTAPRNQTVPPGPTKIYLPAIYSTHSLTAVLEQSGDFNTLLQLMEAADLTIELDAGGPFTLFAPTDAAWDNLPVGALDQLLENPTGQLTQILLFHLVPGEYELDELEHDMQLTTQQGSSITVDRSEESQVTVNLAQILTSDLKANNGIIHAIDTVILPPPPQ
jgi:uncharacterized surface protein with fasciclin (FAS1) repeats